jgi:hypothetical protein
MKATGGVWDRKTWPLYFLATWPDQVEYVDTRTNLLVAVNELVDPEKRMLLEEWAEQDRRIFLDSGVYWLATQHARAHGMSMNEALGIAPDKMDGFEDLFAAYVEIVKGYESHLWGYIEIDQGGKDNKRRTRRQLEKLGLSPIPVYHPLNDGWDYFDELASEYDRICLGNVVMASPEQRKRLLATMWERRRKYPNLWIHALGLTPNEMFLAYPMNSCDSSAWISNARWGRHKVVTAAQAFGELVDGFVYSRDEEDESERGYLKAWRLAGYDAVMLGRTMGNIKTDVTKELGADVGLFDQHHS